MKQLNEEVSYKMTVLLCGRKLEFLHGQGVRIEERCRRYIAVSRISKKDTSLPL